MNIQEFRKKWGRVGAQIFLRNVANAYIKPKDVGKEIAELGDDIADLMKQESGVSRKKLVWFITHNMNSSTSSKRNTEKDFTPNEVQALQLEVAKMAEAKKSQ